MLFNTVAIKLKDIGEFIALICLETATRGAYMVLVLFFMS